VRELVLGRDAVRVVVTDGGSSKVPSCQPQDALRPGGRGLFLVESLSDS
jgi:anti-sigma regulatory factor (Ser/Thr protein kinase)